jgi:hypothetical protein
VDGGGNFPLNYQAGTINKVPFEKIDETDVEAQLMLITTNGIQHQLCPSFWATSFPSKSIKKSTNPGKKSPTYLYPI